ncbi:MAG: cytochrome b/b6 domain-containing protein [Candidatus Ozemobacteraceae bacterium]
MKRIHLPPRLQRIWHWTNAGIVTVLIVTGFYLRLYGLAALKPHDPVLSWHKYLGLVMIISTVLWHLHAMSSENPSIRYGIPKKDLKSMPAQARYYLYLIFTGAVMFILLIVLGATGLLFFDIQPVQRYILSENLVALISTVHVVFYYIVVIFFIVHLYLAILKWAKPFSPAPKR